MKNNSNHIDELFKSRLEGVESVPSAGLKAALVKEVSYLILKNTIISVVLVAAGVAAVGTSGYLAYNSYYEEKDKIVAEHLAQMTQELNLDYEIEEHAQISLKILGSPMNGSTAPNARISLDRSNTPHSQYNTAALAESGYDSESNLYSSQYYTQTNNSESQKSSYSKSTPLSQTTHSISGSIKDNVNHELPNNSSSLFHDDQSKHVSDKGLDASEVSVAMLKQTQNLETTGAKLETSINETKNSLSEITADAKETGLANFLKGENIKPLQSTAYAYSSIKPEMAAHNLSSAKKHRPIAGPLLIGLTGRYSVLETFENQLSLNPESNGLDMSIDNSTFISYGLMARKKVGAVGINFGLEHSILNSNYSLTSRNMSYTTSIEYVETFEPITIGGEVVLDEEGNPILESVITPVTITDSSQVTVNSNGINKFKYISLPLGLSYDLHEGRNFSFGLSSEFIYNRLYRASGVTLNSDNSELSELGINSSEVNKNVLSMNLGFMVNFRMRHGLNLNINPSYSFNSNHLQLGEGSSNNYNSGGYIRVSLLRSL